jgi:hypothetical protein
MRPIRQLLATGLAVGLLLVAAAPAAAEGEPVTLPILGYTFDPLSAPEPEPVPDVQQPQASKKPVYDRSVGRGLATSDPWATSR